MSNYDLLVAVVRDKGGAPSLNSSVFLVGASMICLVGLIILLRKTRHAEGVATTIETEE